MIREVKFESQDRREKQILAALNANGIASIEEANQICEQYGLDPYLTCEETQRICFENAKWAYVVGTAIALKIGCKNAADAAEAIGIGLSYTLESEKYEVTLVKTVAEAKKTVENEEFDLYILDLTLPDGNGYEVCSLIKSKGDLPVIFLTAYDDEINVVTGFELGADDYISKPFRVRELLARVKSVLRRYSKDNADGIVKIGELSVNTAEARVLLRGEEVILTAMEYRLLLSFVNNQGTVLTRRKLLEEIWDVDGDFVNDNTLTVYIKRLRDKIENDPNDPQYIKTVRGMGYLMK